MSATEVIRVRVTPEEKRRLMRLYEGRGTTLSREIRAFLSEELSSAGDPVAVLDGIAESAAQKVDAAGLGDPSIEEIVAYVDRVRAERSRDMLVAS